ncbi:murein transglycosylase A [Desulfovibrio aminophilus]|uniref:murein transglycosylase A n=1 Tax=Desulfovibrio aminophilus TaxID=81425 RepID=UPI00041265F5|nr:murein transglycosylase A [Desulfovibrio aminophilus]
MRQLHRAPLSCAALALALLVIIFGCAPRAPKVPSGPPALPAPVLEAPGYQPLPSSEAASLSLGLTPSAQGLSSWRELAPGLRRSLAYVSSRPAEATAVDRPGLRLTWADLRATLEDLLRLLPELDRDPAVLAREFVWFQLAPETLLSGYYEPWLKASLTPAPGYPVPLYGPPDDLQVVDLGRFHPKWQGQQLTYRLVNGRLEPYHDRAAIDGRGALNGRGLEIAWTRDPVDVFFLQIQGSGRLVLPDGRVKHVLYAGKNGREYVSLAKIMDQRGLLPREAASMPAIRSLLAERPDLRRELLDTNPSYVFFRLADDGPYGSAGQVLTPFVSAAVDRGVMPLGAVFALDTRLPVPAGGEERFRGLMLAQDTGGAIKQTRVDLFCGSDERGEFVAGRLKSQARVMVVVSKRVLGLGK